MKIISIFFVIFMLFIVGGTIASTVVIQSRITATSDHHFKSDTDVITNGVIREIEAYNTLLYSGRALITSSEKVTETEWRNFYSSQSSLDRYKGVGSVYFIQPVAAKEVDNLERQIRQEPYFGSDFTVQRSPEKQIYGVVSLIFSNNDLSSSFGFDGFTGFRQAVYERSAATNSPTASGPFKFATGHYGFILALPVFNSDKAVKGYVGVSLRADDFAAAVSRDNNNNASIEISDVTDAPNPTVLYTKVGQNDSKQLVQTTTIGVADRKWQIKYATQRSYDDTRISRVAPKFAVIIGALLALLTCTWYVSVRRRRMD